MSGIHNDHTWLISSWQLPRTVFYILTRLEANGASPPSTQENTEASRLGTTPVHTCMSSAKSLSEQTRAACHHACSLSTANGYWQCWDRLSLGEAETESAASRPSPGWNLFLRSYIKTKHTEGLTRAQFSTRLAQTQMMRVLYKAGRVLHGYTGEEMTWKLGLNLEWKWLTDIEHKLMLTKGKGGRMG